MTTAKVHSGLLTVLGAILGVIGGVIGAYSFMEKRIIEDADRKTETRLTIQGLQKDVEKIDAREWADADRFTKAIQEQRDALQIVRSQFIETNKPKTP